MAIFNSYVKLPEGIPSGCLMENHHCSVRSIIQIHGGFGQKPWMAMVVLLTTIFDYLVSVIWVLYDIYYIYGIDYIYMDGISNVNPGWTTPAYGRAKSTPLINHGWWIRGWSHRRIFEGVEKHVETPSTTWSTQWYSDHGKNDHDNMMIKITIMINNAIHIHDYICNTMINIYILLCFIFLFIL